LLLVLCLATPKSLRLRAEEIDATQRPISVREVVGCSKGTVAFHAKRVGKVAENPACLVRYDWKEVQAYYDEGHSRAECVRKFGFCSQTRARAVRSGKIIANRDWRIPLEVLLVSDRQQTCRVHLKNRLIRANLLTCVCQICGLTEWRGQSIVLELDHINGKETDNRLENLRLLCPNCHSQTTTYCSKNRLLKNKK
jgi:HNH endonuclease